MPWQHPWVFEWKNVPNKCPWGAPTDVALLQKFPVAIS